LIKKRKEGNSGVTGQSFRLTGQGFRSYWKNGRFIPEKVSGLNRNECPDNPGIGVRTTPEYAFRTDFPVLGKKTAVLSHF
jgi:hypothetical protein